MDAEAAERGRLLAEVSPVLTQLEQAGLLDGVMALPEGALNELLEFAARAQGDSWLPAIAVVMGLDARFVREVVRTVLPFFKGAA